MRGSLTREQVRQVDAIAIRELGIPGVVLMENAGRNAADRIEERLTAQGAGRVMILCGPGNNGGDGFVVARHLLIRGRTVRVYLAGDPTKLTPDAETNHRILRNMGVEIATAATPDAIQAALAEVRETDILVDALLGTGFTGDVREPLASLIRGINAAPKAAVVAIDVPSGLDCDTGRPGSATIRADSTITFVANKVGFDAPGAAAYTGQVSVADIGCPPDLLGDR